MLKSLLKKYKKFSMWKRIVWNAKTDFKVSKRNKIKYALKGFSANEIVWYQLDKNDYLDYISEFERLQSRGINGNYKFILDDKLVFEEVFSKYVKVPTNYAWISDGVVYGLHAYSGIYDAIKIIRIAGKSVLKWLDRGGGEGTYILEIIDDIFMINGQISKETEVQTLFSRKGKAILCEYMAQSEFAASLYPYTANIIRIVCAKKKEEHKAKVIAAVQRIGCHESIPVDNFHSGGMVCQIDIDTGMISAGIKRYNDTENYMRIYEKHPDEGFQIKGKIIPNWVELKSKIEELTNSIPYLNFVAWDVLLVDGGFCVIEGNASSGCGMFQMTKGVRDSALGDIYRSYGVIK